MHTVKLFEMSLYKQLDVRIVKFLCIEHRLILLMFMRHVHMLIPKRMTDRLDY